MTLIKAIFTFVSYTCQKVIILIFKNQYLNFMTTKDLDKLKSKLPKKYRIILWRRLNKYSLSAISSVLRGDYNNNEIIDAAIQLAEEHQNELTQYSEKIKSL